MPPIEEEDEADVDSYIMESFIADLNMIKTLGEKPEVPDREYLMPVRMMPENKKRVYESTFLLQLGAQLW